MAKGQRVGTDLLPVHFTHPKNVFIVITDAQGLMSHLKYVRKLKRGLLFSSDFVKQLSF